MRRHRAGRHCGSQGPKERGRSVHRDAQKRQRKTHSKYSNKQPSANESAQNSAPLSSSQAEASAASFRHRSSCGAAQAASNGMKRMDLRTPTGDAAAGTRDGAFTTLAGACSCAVSSALVRQAQTRSTAQTHAYLLHRDASALDAGLLKSGEGHELRHLREQAVWKATLRLCTT